MTTYERIIEFTPAYDKRDDDPAKNYGVHGVNLRFVLKGPEGAVQFLLYTNWHLPHVAKEWENKPRILTDPMPADVGYHSPVPMYEDQLIMSETCSYLDGKPCYYDGSGLMAQDGYEALVSGGGPGIWDYLENYYRATFEDGAE